MRLLVTSLMMIVSFTFLHGVQDRVLSSQARKKLLESADMYSAYPQTLKKQDFEKLDIGFYEQAAKDNASADISVEHMTDKDVIDYAAKKYLPKGTISRQDALYLMFDFGPVREGKLFNAKIAKAIYPIRVVSITEETYTLGYGTEKITVRLSDAIKVQKKTGDKKK